MGNPLMGILLLLIVASPALAIVFLVVAYFWGVVAGRRAMRAGGSLADAQFILRKFVRRGLISICALPLIIPIAAVILTFGSLTTVFVVGELLAPVINSEDVTRDVNVRDIPGTFTQRGEEHAYHIAIFADGTFLRTDQFTGEPKGSGQWRFVDDAIPKYIVIEYSGWHEALTYSLWPLPNGCFEIFNADENYFRCPPDTDEISIGWWASIKRFFR